MKKLCIILLTFMTIPLISMENERAIQFMGDHTDYPVIAVKESNLCLIKTLHKHYRQHCSVIKNSGIVPPYPHVSGQALALVNDALNVRPDKFADFYCNKLTPHGRKLLIQASGQYDEHGKKVMLDVPEITKRLIDVYFVDGKGLRKYIKQYIGKDDEDYLRSYFKERLISSKRLLSLKQPCTSFFDDYISSDISLGSLFTNAAHTINQYDYPIPLRIENNVHQTYAFSFGIDNYEYRITDVQDKKCLLWVINHDNPQKTLSTLLKHKKSIKGCRFSSAKGEQGVEYVLTYSDKDMTFSTITMQNGVSCVESKTVDIPKGQIVDVCFDPASCQWCVGLYEDLANVFKRFNTQGEFLGKNAPWVFKQFGLFEKMMIYKTSCQYKMLKLFSVAQLYYLSIGDPSDDGIYCFKEGTSFYSRHSHNMEYGNLRHLISTPDGNGVEVIVKKDYFFVENNTGSLFDIWSQPDTDTHRVYSPDGAYLMCNALKRNRLGILYVETLIKDAVTRKEILSIDSLYTDFNGVGFTHDATELIFLARLGTNQKVSLLSPEDKQMLSEVEDIAFDDLGVISLLKRLCMEYRKNGILSLSKDSSARAMLVDWSKKSPSMLEFLKTCLPIMK